MIRRLGLLTAFALASLAQTAMFAVSASAQTADPGYYKGKTVRLVVGYAAGGGFDLYARMIAPYIGKALGASVIVENQPGAGGISALNRMMTMPPDGLQIMLVNGSSAIFSQFTDQPGVRFDLAKLEHLGTVSGAPWVWLATAKAPYDTPQQILDAKKRFMWSAGGPIDGLSDGAAFTCEALKLDCNIVLGYPGSNESAMSVGRGEMDMMYIVDTSAANYISAGQVKVIAAMGRTRSRIFPDTPTIFETVKLAPEAAALLDFHATADRLGRILVAAPGTPADRVAALTEAVKASLTDPALIAEGEKSQRFIGFIDATETRKAALAILTEPTIAEKKRMIEILSKVEKK